VANTCTTSLFPPFTNYTAFNIDENRIAANYITVPKFPPSEINFKGKVAFTSSKSSAYV